jgi:hypothetical protein
VAMAAARTALPDAGPWNLGTVRAIQLWQLNPGGSSMNGRMGCHGTDGSGPRSSRAAIGAPRSCSTTSTGPSLGVSGTP